MANIQLYFNSLLSAYLTKLIYELKSSYKFYFNILDLSLNSYIGIFFIIIGLLVRIDFKFSIQKDFK